MPAPGCIRDRQWFYSCHSLLCFAGFLRQQTGPHLLEVAHAEAGRRRLAHGTPVVAVVGGHDVWHLGPCEYLHALVDGTGFRQVRAGSCGGLGWGEGAQHKMQGCTKRHVRVCIHACTGGSAAAASACAGCIAGASCSLLILRVTRAIVSGSESTTTKESSSCSLYSGPYAACQAPKTNGPFGPMMLLTWPARGERARASPCVPCCGQAGKERAQC